MEHKMFSSIMSKASPRAAHLHDSQSLPRQAQRSSLATVRRRRAAAALAMAATSAAVSVGAHGATLRDSADRTVTVTQPVAGVVPAGPPAQVLLQALSPAKLVGLVEPFAPRHVAYVAPGLLQLPQIPRLTRTDAPGDIAAIAALKPSLAVDYGRVSARYVAAIENAQQKLGVPAAIFDGSLIGAPAVVTSLGAAIGEPARGVTLSALIERVLAASKPLADLPDAQRVAVYLARGEDGLDAARSGSAFDETIRLAGGRNVVAAGTSAFRQMSVAEVVALKPSVVVFAEPGALSSPLHAALPKGTRFVIDAGEPYKVLTGPPSLNRVIGLAALAPILHPRKVITRPDASVAIETTLFPPPQGVTLPQPLRIVVDRPSGALRH